MAIETKRKFCWFPVAIVTIEREHLSAEYRGLEANTNRKYVGSECSASSGRELFCWILTCNQIYNKSKLLNMSSRRVPAAVPFKPSAAPVLVTSRAVSLKSSIKINGMGSSTAQSEQHSRLPTKPTTSAITSKDLVSNSKMGSKSSSSTTKPLWHSVRSLGSRVAPSNKQVKDKLNNSVEQQMVSSTGTESSGVFSDTENNDRLDVVPNNNNRFLRPPQTSTSRLSAAVAKTASFRLVKRPTPPNTAGKFSKTTIVQCSLYSKSCNHVCTWHWPHYFSFCYEKCVLPMSCWRFRHLRSTTQRWYQPFSRLLQINYFFI